jgi:hypothetical protein
MPYAASIATRTFSLSGSPFNPTHRPRLLPKARAEWALICIGHNLLKLHTARRAA